MGGSRSCGSSGIELVTWLLGPCKMDCAARPATGACFVHANMLLFDVNAHCALAASVIQDRRSKWCHQLYRLPGSLHDWRLAPGVGLPGSPNDSQQ